MRQLQKERQSAHVGPGSTEYLKPLGAELSKMTLGGKGKIFNPVMANPGPGQYDIEDAFNSTHNKSSVSVLKGPKRFDDEKKKKKVVVGPGKYDPIEVFGATKNKFTLGSRRDLKINDNPAPHTYEFAKAYDSI